MPMQLRCRVAHQNVRFNVVNVTAQPGNAVAHEDDAVKFFQPRQNILRVANKA